jgi:hypothetical protein
MAGSERPNSDPGLAYAVERRAGSVETPRGSRSNRGLREELDASRARAVQGVAPQRASAIDERLDVE